MVFIGDVHWHEMMRCAAAPQSRTVLSMDGHLLPQPVALLQAPPRAWGHPQRGA